MDTGAKQMAIRRVIPKAVTETVAEPVAVVPGGELNPSLLGGEAQRIRDFMTGRVIGQPEAVEAVCEAHQVFSAGLDAPGRPVASLFFMGPTGVGKTKVCEALAEAIHGTPKALLKIDCGEYQMEHEVAKLIGAPPGYLGHRETQPILSQARLRASGSEKSKLTIVLFDEIEKAAPSMWRVLLGVLDKGKLTLGDNSTVDFTDSIVFFTSNLGVKEINQLLTPGLGFTPPPETIESIGASKLSRRIESVALGAVARSFPAEFLNRLDKQIVFNPLTPETLRLIQGLEVTAIQNRINERVPVKIVLDPLAKEWLVTANYVAKYGARQMKRQLEQYLVHPIANIIQSGQVRGGDVVLVSCNQLGLTFIKESVDGKSLEAINA